MNIVHAGEIHTLCHPNALLTFAEYIQDYGDDELKAIGSEYIERECEAIKNPQLRERVQEGIKKIEKGERDLYV